MTDMSMEAIDARLREASRLAELRAGTPAVDMSPAAVTQRLEEVAGISQLCAELVEIGRSAGLSR
jgi:hypothetical protein